jgi:hypothetical protein
MKPIHAASRRAGTLSRADFTHSPDGGRHHRSLRLTILGQARETLRNPGFARWCRPPSDDDTLIPRGSSSPPGGTRLHRAPHRLCPALRHCMRQRIPHTESRCFFRCANSPTRRRRHTSREPRLRREMRRSGRLSFGYFSLAPPLRPQCGYRLRMATMASSI